jgi:hypothetical protein
VALKYVIEVDDKGTPKFQKFGQEAERANKKTELLSSGMAKFAIGAFAAYKAGQAVVGGVMALNNAYAKRQESVINLTRTMGYESRALYDLAQARANVTDISVQDTLASQALIANSIRSEDAIARLTPVIQDFAVATGKDMKSATEAVTKSITSETNALQRNGISISGAVGSSERLESTVKALEARYKGAAEQMSIADGGTQSLANSMQDLAADVGGLLQPALIGAVTALSSLTAEWKAFIKERSKDSKEQVFANEMYESSLRDVVEAESRLAEMQRSYRGQRKFYTKDELAEQEQKIKALKKESDFYLSAAYNAQTKQAPAGKKVEGIGAVIDEDTKAKMAEASAKRKEDLEKQAAEAEKFRIASAMNERARMAKYEDELRARDGAAAMSAYNTQMATEASLYEMKIARMTEEEQLIEAARVRKEERIAIDESNAQLRREAELSFAHEMEAIEADADRRKQEAHTAEMQRIQAEREARIGVGTSILGSLASIAGMSKKNAKLQKGLLIAEAWGNTYLAATRALANPPAPNFFAASAALIAGGAQVANISAKMVRGGLINGSNTLIMANEAGQEFVGNATMTRTLGKDFIDRGNGGASKEELADLIRGNSKGGGIIVNISGAVTPRFVLDEIIPALRREQMRSR